jgi:hypothetical protein
VAVLAKELRFLEFGVRVEEGPDVVLYFRDMLSLVWEEEGEGGEVSEEDAFFHQVLVLERHCL